MTSSASPSSPSRSVPQNIWIPIVCALLIVIGESTRVMGSDQTKLWLLSLVNIFRHQALTPHFEAVHHTLRKIGHFLGYGALGLLLARGWLFLCQRRLHLSRQLSPLNLQLAAASLALLSTFVIACTDELHQSFLPGRNSSFTDVLIDVSGALLFNLVLISALTLQQRRRAQSPTAELVAWPETLPARRSA